MKILAISDLHGELSENLLNYIKTNEIDIVIVSGDITNFGPGDLGEGLLNKIANQNVKVFAIPGNCDPKDIFSYIDNSNAINIHNSIFEMDDIGLCGFGGSNATPFDTPLEYDENEIYGSLCELLPSINDKKVKILVTHAPPIDTFVDEIEGGAHVGSSSVRKIIEEYQPDIALCGHIHEAIAVDKIGDTIILNPGHREDGNAGLIIISSEFDEITAQIIEL